MKFKPPEHIRKAWLSNVVPDFAKRPQQKRGAKRRGIVYENKVHEYLDSRFGEFYLPSPWFQFIESASQRTRWCQPDGLLFMLPKLEIVVVEIKYRHTADAYMQSKLLYKPVLERVFNPEIWTLSYLEICKWHDPADPFPVDYTLCADPTLVNSSRFSVHIWNPQRG